jgi:hypothetical protein
MIGWKVLIVRIEVAGGCKPATACRANREKEGPALLGDPGGHRRREKREHRENSR